MDLTQLKWTKNVNHQGDDKYWAYQNVGPVLNIFQLNWKTEQAENALKPEESELILLRQRTKVTHIVKLLNNTLYKETPEGEFGISRRVQVIWIADYSSLPPEQDMVFGYHVHLQGGKVMKLETPTIQQTLGEPRRISSISKASSKHAYIRTIRYVFPGVLSDRITVHKSKIKTAIAKLGESPAIL